MKVSAILLLIHCVLLSTRDESIFLFSCGTAAGQRLLSGEWQLFLLVKHLDKSALIELRDEARVDELFGLVIVDLRSPRSGDLIGRI
jgi:hypothetical protein